MTALDVALATAAKGWRVFPCDGKQAVVPWKRMATSNPKAVRQLFSRHPNADNVGIALPEGTVVLDVDDPEAFGSAGLKMPDAPGQKTPSGGYHRLFHTNGHAQQTVKVIPGADTRVGGKGYIVVWDAQSLPTIDTLPDAPAWVYGRTKKVRVDLSGDRIPETQRNSTLASLAGSMRDRGMGEDAIYAALKVENDARCDPPLPDADVRTIAKSVARYAPGNVPDKIEQADIEIIGARELLAMEFPDLQWAIEGILPEGAAVLAAAPKIGKSWLLDDWALAIAEGSRAMASIPVEQGEVLLLPLEDSRRRMQSRLKTLLHSRPVPKTLDIAFDWPRFGEGFTEAVEQWIAAHPHARLIGVDTLAKVRPLQKGNRQLYEVDYQDLSVLASIVKRKAGLALVAVHHDRKADAEDFLDSVSGSHGVTGAADTVQVLRRSRGSADAVLHVTGRDVEEDAHALRFTAGKWELTGAPIAHGTEERNAIALWLAENGPAGPSQVATGLKRPKDSTRRLMLDMRADGQLVGGGQAYHIPIRRRR